MTRKVNRALGYWTVEQLLEALANPLDRAVVGSQRISLKRRKRDGNIWTDEDIQTATALDTDVSLETLRALGIEANDITLFETELSPKHIADVNEYPFNNYGKLFVKSSGGGGHCSASFVRERVLLTAAHCVKHANGQWFDHFRFYQRFNGIEDQGRIVEVEKPYIYANYIDENGGMELRYIYRQLVHLKQTANQTYNNYWNFKIMQLRNI